MGYAEKHNPLVTIFIGHLLYPWHVALQQSMLPFIQTRQIKSILITSQPIKENKQPEICLLEAIVYFTA